MRDRGNEVIVRKTGRSLVLRTPVDASLAFMRGSRRLYARAPLTQL